MGKIKVVKITPFYPNLLEKKMVGYFGTIEDSNCSNIQRPVLFLCNPSGVEVSARVPNSRIMFKFCDSNLNVHELEANQVIEVEQHQIDASKENENYLTLIEMTK